MDVATSGSIAILVKFRVRGNLRFLSHAETSRVFQRACVRAGIRIAYSQGFNPHPKLSLPLPRSVGVESDDELLCIQIETLGPADEQSETLSSQFDSECFKAKLSSQLPEGLELLAVNVAKTKTPVQPKGAVYLLPVHQQYLGEGFKTMLGHLLATERLEVERQIDEKGNIRILDVRSYLKSIEFADRGVVVACNISSNGTIRVDEILKLLELDVGKLAAPIRRISVQWDEEQ